MASGERLERSIEDRSARVAVVGLGYAGLPLAVAFVGAGFRVLGYDRDTERVDRLQRGSSYVPDVETQSLRRAVGSGALAIASRPSILDDADVTILCVPTPLDARGQPDTSHLEAAAGSVADHVRKDALVVVESTSYPGTTEELVGGILTSRGLVPGRDAFLAFSSERIDPGNARWRLPDIPKVVGGVDPRSLELARRLYSHVAPSVVTVSSPATAEMAKLVENAFREVNIAFANEIARACRHLDLDPWEVIDAAATKPFGFMAFYPGPGRGGHCIPSDPVYLQWRLAQQGFRPRLIEEARSVNEGMPSYVVDRVLGTLEDQGIPPARARVLLLGVAYKRDIADTRDTPAVALIEGLKAAEVRVAYHDPHVSRLRINGTQMSCRDLGAGLAEADCVVVVADHSDYDWQSIVDRARCVLDCRGVLRGVRSPKVKRL